MRSTLLVAGAVFAWGAAAQQTTPANPNTQTPAAQSSTSTSTSTSSSSSRPAEMKTQKYKGTLVDASCAGGGSAPAASASSQGSAERSAAGGSSCGVSASTTKFALQMQDGKTVPFDLVGNERAQMAMKNKKKWSEMAQAGKPVKVKVSGVMSGDKLTVVTVD